MAELKPYLEYKDSGVEFIGKIPKEWNISKIKYLTKINELTLSKNTDPTTELKYIDIGSVDSTGTILLKEKMLFQDTPSRARRILRKNDTIISTVRTYLRAIATINEEDNLVGSTGFAVLTPTEQINSSYLSYLLHTPNYVDQIVSRSVGVSYPAITSKQIGDLKCLLPDEISQNKIVSFLQLHISNLDTIISDKERLIALLEEKRQAVITETVTRGLDPNVPMKDSGIEWIGEIPEHWKMIKLNYLFGVIGSGGTPNSSNTDYYNGDIPWINTGDLNDGYITKNKSYITEKAMLENSTLKVYPENSLLVAMYGATIGKVGITRYPAATNQACSVLSNPRLVNIKYMYYWFLSSRTDIINRSVGGGQPNISQSIIKQLKVPVPKINEQIEINSFLDKLNNAINQLKNSLQHQIIKLKEYRESLIYEAVTGKIDVRDYTDYTVETEEVY